MLLIMFILVSSCVFAGPFRDVEIYVVDPSGQPVQDANVSMYYSYNNYFNYSGVTNSDGYLLLVVDARIWELVQDNVYMNLTEGVNPNNNADRVPIKETTTRITGNVVKDDPKNPATTYPSYPLYPVMTFNYDLTSQGVYDFIPMTFERNFSLRHNVELEFVVSDGTPLINLPEDLETNEDNDHEIIINLEDYITDYDNSFDELDITIIDEVWSAADASIEVVNDELVVDFLPALNLDYHQDNTVTFTIKADDGVHSNEKEYSYSYVPEYKALRGVVSDLYFNNSVINSDIDSNFVSAIISSDSSEFMFFYDTNEVKVQISNPDYYLSQRYFIMNSDTFLNFTIVPIQEDTMDYDEVEDQFDCSFRWLANANGDGTYRYIEEPTMFLCLNESYYNYEPTSEDIQNQITAAQSVAEFTGGFITFTPGTTLLQGDDCIAYAGDYNIMVFWNPDMPALGGNSVDIIGNVLVDSMLRYKGGCSAVDMSTYYQETLQGLGPRRDCNIINSIFNDPGAPLYPTYYDFRFGQRLYSREAGNLANDLDPSYDSDKSDYNKKIYTEVLRVEDVFIDNKKVRIIKVLGYVPKGDINKDNMIKELPSNSILELFRNKNSKDFIELKMKRKIKLNSNIKNKLQKLIN